VHDDTIDLSGGTIVVTGGGSGIGEGIAHAAAGAGMRVVVADVVDDRAEAVAAALRAGGGEAVAVATDVGDAAALERLADVAYATFGAVRLLVNNAGVEATGQTWRMAPARWEQVIRVNLIGAFHGVRAFVPRMLEQGERAAIVNLSSIAALSSGPPQQSAYNASKHGVQGLSECLHLELVEIGAPISVHVVTPGPVRTRIFTDGVADSTDAEQLRDFFGRFVADHGISGREAGDMILDGLRRGEFWIRTHPAMQQDAVRRRAEMLVARTAPELVRTESLQEL
jgi:NAD(P)-dependent dehydrogenase (short-subunit alcohol dehydrogenase family)